MNSAPLAAGHALLTGPSQVREFVRANTAAAGAITAEVSVLRSGSVVDELARAAEAGRPVSIVVNHADRSTNGQARLDALRAAGADIRIYGDDVDGPDAPWLHSKVWHFDSDHPRALVSNLPMDGRSKGSSELAIVLEGSAAERVGDLVRATRSGDRAAMHDAAEAAARVGVVSNDPLSGGNSLARTLDQLARTPGRDVLVAVKELNHPESTAALIDTLRGARTSRLVVRDLGHADARLLEAAGQPVEIVRRMDPKLRTNAVVVDDRAYLGSAFFWDRQVDLDRIATRDVGVVVDGAGARGIRAATAELVDHYRGGVSIQDARRGDLLI